MKKVSLFDLMEELRLAGWMVTLKVAPSHAFYFVEARSEYDPPCEQIKIAAAHWSCEAQYLGKGSYLLSQWHQAETAQEAVEAVWRAACKERERVDKRDKEFGLVPSLLEGGAA